SPARRRIQRGRRPIGRRPSSFRQPFMRVIIILILIVIAIGMVRMLVGDVIKAVSKTMKSAPDAEPVDPPSGSKSGRLVKDHETGNYIDERTALKAEVKGTTYYFESAAGRDAFLRKHRS